VSGVPARHGGQSVDVTTTSTILWLISGIFFQNFESPGDWDGSITDKGTPAANKHVVAGHSSDQYFGRKIRVGIRKPPAAVGASTYLTFDYDVEGSDFRED
jgi:hypothetical protein